jgi:hypothetical protein
VSTPPRSPGTAEDINDLQLLASAKDFAASALETFTQGHWNRWALYAGTSLEHLAKAALYRRSPVLLIEPGNRAHHEAALLHFAGQKRTPDVRTISAQGALDRARTLIDGLRSVDWAQVQRLLSLRDGTVHVAIPAQSDQAALVAYLGTIGALLSDLDEDPGTFWGARSGVVQAALAQHRSAVVANVEVLIAAAKARYAEMFADNPSTSAILTDAIQRQLAPSDADQQHIHCPGCGCEALAVGFSEVDWRHEQIDEDDWEWTGAVTFFPFAMRCTICGLALDDPDELEAAGLPSEITLIDADPYEYGDNSDDYEPDEDIWRGR